MHIPIAGSFETSLRHEFGHLSSTEPLPGRTPSALRCLCATRRDDSVRLDIHTRYMRSVTPGGGGMMTSSAQGVWEPVLRNSDRELESK
jgi:hypothetical protein